MTIYQELCDIEDSRTGGTKCSLNCYLEDFIANHLEENDSKISLFRALFEMDNDLRIITDLKAVIDKEQISNIIIRYRDVYKLKNKSINVPYLIYSRDNKVAVIHDDYIVAKSLYFLLSDSPNCLLNNRKNTLCLSTDFETKEAVRYFKSLNNNANILQREIDKSYFESIDKAIEIVADRSKRNVISIENYKHNKDVKRLEFIDKKIEETYLLKKFIYIQYMLDKDALKNKHSGDIKKQRLEAKLQADSVVFIPYQKMWDYTSKK